MLNTTITITILKRNPLLCSIVVSHPTFDVLKDVETWLSTKLIHARTKQHIRPNATVYKSYRVEFWDEKYVDEFIDFASTMTATYAIDSCFDEYVAIVKSPGNTWFAIGKDWDEGGTLDLGYSITKQNGCE